MLNLEHQDPSSVRRDGEDLSLANHIKKEQQLRQRLEYEKESKKEIVGKLNNEKEEIKQKTKQVVELFKHKLSETELDLSSSRLALQTLESKSQCTSEMLKDHLNKWRKWHSYNIAYESSKLMNEEFNAIAFPEPTKFLSATSDNRSIDIATASEIPTFLISELDTILKYNNEGDLIFGSGSIPCITVGKFEVPAHTSQLKNSVSEALQIAEKEIETQLLQIENKKMDSNPVVSLHSDATSIVEKLSLAPITAGTPVTLETLQALCKSIEERLATLGLSAEVMQSIQNILQEVLLTAKFDELVNSVGTTEGESSSNSNSRPRAALTSRRASLQQAATPVGAKKRAPLQCISNTAHPRSMSEMKGKSAFFRDSNENINTANKMILPVSPPKYRGPVAAVTSTSCTPVNKGLATMVGAHSTIKKKLLLCRSKSLPTGSVAKLAQSNDADAAVNFSIFDDENKPNVRNVVSDLSMKFQSHASNRAGEDGSSVDEAAATVAAKQLRRENEGLLSSVSELRLQLERSELALYSAQQQLASQETLFKEKVFIFLFIPCRYNYF
jgi:hypothetical protein